ncbi:MAG: hypothetical protein ACFFD4_08010 [Candidatus Odinarchaeota archaeon]
MPFECKCYATVSENDERAKVWTKCLGERQFPLKHPIPGIVKVALRDQEPFDMTVYLGDPDRLTNEQKEKLIEHIQSNFGVPRQEIISGWTKQGIPIKAENLTITFCHNHTMAML